MQLGTVAAFLGLAAGDVVGAGQAIQAELFPPGGADASAAFVDARGRKVGSVAFADGPRGALIRVDVSGLSEGWHAMHLHEVGDCSDGAEGFKASKSHINPDGREHGLLNPEGDERADIPNIRAGADGRATAEVYRPGVAINGGDGLHAMLDNDGFAVIIHENEDDHRTQPIGGAGGRIACAAITVEEAKSRTRSEGDD